MTIHENIDMNEAMKAAIQAALCNINTCMPGEITSINNGRATIQPLLVKRFTDGETLQLPALSNVPLIFPRTKNGGIQFPVSSGDGCLLLFSQRALERWKSDGGIVEPGDPRKFDLSDAVAIPGLFPLSVSALQNDEKDLLIKNGNATITLKQSGDIEIKGNANLKKLVNEEFQDLFNNHGHDYVSPGGPTQTGTPVLGLPPVGSSTPITNNELTSDTRAS